MHIYDLDTPALLVDLDLLESNLTRVAGYAQVAGLALRPHTKTHKTPQIAQMQLTHGAAGITTAKLGEAEVMAGAGIADIFIANEIVGPQKIARLIKLTHIAQVSVGVDSVENAAPLSAAFASEGQRLPVMLEFDLGIARCGAPPETAAGLATRICDMPGLTIAGVFGYSGQVYGSKSESEVAAVAAQDARLLSEIAQNVSAVTGTPLRISGGSTPTAKHYQPNCGLTEIRPGTYVFNDRTQIARWSARPEDCALTVLATVVSRPGTDRAVLDSGSKCLGTDGAAEMPGQGMLKEDTTAFLPRVSEEHGVVDLTESSLSLHVGDKVEVIPNHCCSVVNLFDEMVVVRNGNVVDTWPIAGRGKCK